MRLQGVLFQAGGALATTIDRSFDAEWSEVGLAEVFPETLTANKLAIQMWSPALYRVGYKRCNAGVDKLTAVILDCDCADVGQLEAVCEALSGKGLAYWCHSSYSHRKSGKLHKGSGLVGAWDCFRVILPLSRHVDPEEYRVLVPALFGNEVPSDPAHYAGEVRGKLIENKAGVERAAQPRGFDPTSNQPARAYFVPATAPELAEHAVFTVAQGEPIDANVVLRRPSTRAAWARRSRTYSTPTAAAVGALRDVVSAFTARGVNLGVEGHAGWRRAPCPVCAPDGQQNSPSFTVRANGEHVEVYCHSSDCVRRSRAAFLEALGLTAEGRFAAPSEVVLQIEEQLARQIPAEAVPVAEAVERLVVDIREAVEAREPTVIVYPAGTGKSYAAAQVLTERVRAGYRVAYATQEHRVAAETRAYLPPDVLARSVHLRSPLVALDNEPTCARAAELHDRVFNYGVSLLGKICPRCPLREGCEAHAEAAKRHKAAESASVVFISHAGINQVFGMDKDGQLKGADTELVVDEMPSTYESVEVSASQLRYLATADLHCAAPTIARVVREVARAWLAGEEPGQVTWGPTNTPLGSAMELAAEWGRLVVREDARPDANDHAELQAADALVRLAAHKVALGTVKGLEHRGATGLAAMLPDACHAALVRRRGVLLTATPLMAALPGFQVRACNVTDGAPVRRIMVPRGARGSKALTSSYWHEATGRRVRRERRDGEGPGIPWPVVDAAIERALKEAERYDPPRVLVATFKPVADALRGDLARWNGRLEVAHYGALRGKNNYMEGRPQECSVVLLLGAPRMNTMPTIMELGLTGEAADQAWTAVAAAEMEQALGRLRLPRRTKPCAVICEGDVAPASWGPESVDEWWLDERGVVPESALRERACWWRPSNDVTELLAAGEPLAELARPGIDEAMRLLAEMPPTRQAAFLNDFTWCYDGT